MIKLETYNKIDLNFIPRKSSDLNPMVEKLVQNCKFFIGYDIPVEQMQTGLPKNLTLPKSKHFSFNVKRILYNSYKISIKFIADNDFLYEVYEGPGEQIVKINALPISEILYLICYETEYEFFELVMKSNARYLYQSNAVSYPNSMTYAERNVIVTNLIDLIANKNLEEENGILILSSKPKFAIRVNGFINDEVDWEYEKVLFNNLHIYWDDDKKRENIIEDICLNFCCKSEKFKNEVITNKKIYQQIYDMISKEVTKLEELLDKGSMDAVNRELYILNIYLILCRTLITKSHYDKLITDLLTCVQTINFQTIFYNSISIFKTLIPTKGLDLLKKDEIAQRRWIISSHFDYATKIKSLLFKKIYDNKQKIANFEEKNILSIYILLELIKNIYEFSRTTNTLAEISKEFNQFEFLEILYFLLICNSNIIKQIALEILLMLLKNLPYEEEFHLKNLILSRTLIFFVVLNTYVKSPNELVQILTLKFMKTFLISHVETTNLVMNIFPMTLFYYIDKKPNPINWLDHEWDNFFKAIIRDHNTTQVIWNQLCRNELSDYINNLVKSYEDFTSDTTLVQTLHLDLDEKENVILNNTNINEEISNKLEKTYSVQSLKRDKFLNSAHFCLNFKEIKVEYQTLKKHAFVWQYYLRRLINESGCPNLQNNIDKPKKFWGKLMSEIINTYNENKVILIIKTMTLLYKFYYDAIGLFKEYKFFTNLFVSAKNQDIKIIIVQLLMVTLEVEDKEIKHPNLKNLIDSRAPDLFINFILELYTREHFNAGLKTFDWENLKAFLDDNIDKTNESFIDSKVLVLKNLSHNYSFFDKQFPNYTNYIYIHDSWEKADKNIKACTLVVRLLKMLLKKFDIMNEHQKINYPVPKIKSMFYDAKLNYFSKIMVLLYSDNENLLQETIDLVLSHFNDPLMFKFITHYTNLIDLLIFYMIKYRSRKIMKYLENLYYYNNIIYGFDFLYKKGKLSEDEIEFFSQYPHANKFLVRYFPINLIYYYLTTDFIEFIKLVQSDNYKPDLIWNSNMLKLLIDSLKLNNEKAINVNFEKKEVLSNFDENFKIQYPELSQKVICFIYYMDIYIKEENFKKIEINHISIITRCLLNKISKKKDLLKSKEIYDDEFFIYLRTLMSLIKHYKVYIGSGLDMLSDLFNLIIEKENQTAKEQEVICIILECFFVTIYNMEPTNELLDYTLTNMNLLIRALKFYFSQIHENRENLAIMERIFESLIELIQKQKVVLDLYNFSQMDSLNFYIHKMLIKEVISKVVENKEPELDSQINAIILKVLNLFMELSTNINSAIYLLKSGYILEILYFCLKYNNKMKIQICDQYAEKSNKILKQLLSLKKDDAKFKEILDSCLSVLNKQLYIDTINNDSFLNKLKSNIENPEFIWNKNLRAELKSKIYELLLQILEGKNIDAVGELKNFKYLSFKDELRINSVYIRIYNKNPTWQLNDPDLFISEVKEFLITCDDPELLEELVNSISNAIVYSKANDRVLNEENFIEKFYKLLKLDILGNKNKNMSEKQTRIIPACLGLLVIFSTNERFLNLVLSPRTFYNLLLIIDEYNTNEYIEPIIKLLRNILKIPEFIEKMNLSIFLFLLKKVILLKNTINKSNKEIVNTLRIEILKAIKKFILNEKVGFAIRSLFEFYLPDRIIDNLFTTKDVGDITVTLDSELELPDLIWNNDAINQSQKLLEEDCSFILTDEENIDKFPNNLFTHKLNPHKCFFFEISDEFRIDNIYLRIFNKNPSYTLGKSLILFLKQINKITLDTVKSFIIINFYRDNINNSIDMKLYNLLQQKLTTCLTAICLIIEQINYNDFNENLGVSNVDEMKNLIKDEHEVDLINLVQRSFEFQKLLSTDIIKQLLNIGSFIFSLDKNYYSSFSHYDNNIRLIYLEILYLLVHNKNGLQLVQDNIDITEILEKLHQNEAKVGDCNCLLNLVEFILALCIYYKLITVDITYMSLFLTRLFDKYVELSNRRTNLLKHLQLLFSRIINDSQYGDSLVNLIKTVKRF
jgi:hypothetical protein